jgi:hypothetical protein
MVGIWTEDYINAKYHLAVAERMLKSYGDYEDKRFLVGVINEMARSVSGLIRAFLIRRNKLKGSAQENLRFFLKEVAPKYMDEGTKNNLFRVLEVQKAQKTSPIEFAKRGDLILLIDGKYRFLTIDRLKELLESVKVAVGRFSE